MKWRLPINVFLLALVMLKAAIPAYAGSPFYLTVERGFSTEEKPVVRLDFTKSREPMVFRVLRPKNLESFLAGQLNISRSYEQPLSDLNPGHYILRGVNTVEMPFGEARSLLSEKFRSLVRTEDFGMALKDPVLKAMVAVPREMTVGPPANFELVREVFVDLQTGGQLAERSSWFWGGEGEEDGQFKIRNIELNPLTDGVYLLQAVQGKVEAQALLQVSSLSVQVKQSSSQLIVRAVDRKLAPVVGAAVSYRDGRGDWIAVDSKTDSNGQLLFNNPAGILDGKLLVRVATTDGRIALSQTDFLASSTVENSVFLVTDRPIFKPGETFFYKGVLRLLENGNLRVPQATKPEAKISLIRADGVPTDISATVPLTEFGSFSGQFSVGANQPPGLYRLLATVDDKPYGGEFRVKDYVKPKFYLDLLDRDPIIRPGEKFTFRFRAKTYSGVVPKQVRFETFVYRKRYEVPQFVLDSGVGLSAGADYFGEVRTASSVAQPQRIYSSVEARSKDSGEAADVASSWSSAPELDNNGEALVSLDIPQNSEVDRGVNSGVNSGVNNGIDSGVEWTYSVVVRAQDSTGSLAVMSETVYSTLSDLVVAAKFPLSVVSTAEKNAVLVTRVTSPGGQGIADAEGSISLSLETAEGQRQLSPLSFRSGSDGFARTTVDLPGAAGVLHVTATVDRANSAPLKVPAKSEKIELLVAGADGQAVTQNKDLRLYTSQSVLSPGEKTKVLALLPERWGNGEKGVLWQTSAGGKVFGVEGTRASGRSRWIEVEAKPEYGTGFFQTLTVPTENGKFAEQTVGFRVVPIDKRLTIRVSPSSDIAEPMKPFSIGFEAVDSKGQPAANVELSVNVVDRAVYSVQPEFRPDILEFFYPLPRLNLANYYSDSLQGYGYADEIRKPNFRLTALKSRSQPSKRTMRDTAGWFPHVVTGADGRASVVVDMPANITEWVVTAIGADKQGRVGEGHGGFRSSSDINIDAIAPQFLFDGDRVQGLLRAENKLQSAVQVGLFSSGSNGLSVSEKGDVPADSKRAISAKSSLQIPLEVSAALADSVSDSVAGSVVSGVAGSGVRGGVGGGGEEYSGLLQVKITAAGNVRAGGADEFELALLPKMLFGDFTSGTLRIGAVKGKRAQLPETPLIPAAGRGEQAVSTNLQTHQRTLSEGGQNGRSDRVAVVLPLPDEAQISRVRVQVSPGLLGAALSAAKNLVSYPYGCTEQLVHTTIPNLVLLDLVKKAGIPKDRLGSLNLDKSIREAKEHAEIGIQKIRARQKSDGGFGLWGNEPNSDFVLTAIVMRALTIAVENEVPGAYAARDRAMGFLSAKSESRSFAATNALDGYLLALLAEARLLSSMKDQYVAYVSEVAAKKDATIADLTNALRIVRSVKGLWWLSPEMRIEENGEILLSRLAGQLSVLSRDRLTAVKRINADFAELGFGPGDVSLLAGALGVLKSFERLAPDVRAQTSDLLRTKMQNGIWYSTYETGEVILSLRELIEDELKQFSNRQDEGRGVSLVRALNAQSRAGSNQNSPQNSLQNLPQADETLLTLSAFPGGYSGEFLAKERAAAFKDLEILGMKEGDIAEVVVTAGIPYSIVESKNNGISLSRRLLRISRSGSYELYKGEALHVGDVVVSELSISRDGPLRWDTPPGSYLVIEDAIPSIAQGLEEDLTYLADAKLVADEPNYLAKIQETQRYPDKTVRVVKLAPGAGMKLYQVWRVAFAGESTLSPAQATDMYNSATNGNTSAERVSALAN